MTRDELDRLVYEYLCKTFEQIEDTLALPWTRGGLEEYGFQQNERAHELSAALVHLDFSPVVEVARELAPEASEDELRKFARRLIEIQILGITAELAAINGDPLDRSPLRKMRPVGFGRIEAPVVASNAPTPKLSVLLDAFREERLARQAWSVRTEKQMMGYLQLMVELLGDPHLGQITKEHLRQLGLDLSRLPANLKQRYPGLTAREALLMVESESGVSRLAPKSVNIHYQAIRSFFKWLVAHEHLATDPASILKDVKTGKAADDRHPFDDEDIRRYFARIEAKSGLLDVEYWVPRIMAFTGCRLGEAAQLCAQDIRQERGIWVVDINDRGEGKSLKTGSSRRVVPMHHRLIELGLPDFAREAPPGFLWPAEMRTASSPAGSPVDKLQKRLSYLLRTAGISDRKKTASHSFRHTMSSRLKALSVPEYQISEILGHELNSMSTGRYGSTTDLASLKSTIDRLRLPI